MSVRDVPVQRERGERVRVSINSGGREVTIECADVNMSVRELADLAEEKWRCTDAKPPHPGIGFSAAIERSEET